MISEKIDKVIREIPDFPKKGINFKDITPLLLHADLTNDIIDSFTEIEDDEDINIDEIFKEYEHVSFLSKNSINLI